MQCSVYSVQFTVYSVQRSIGQFTTNSRQSHKKSSKILWGELRSTGYRRVVCKVHRKYNNTATSDGLTIQPSKYRKQCSCNTAIKVHDTEVEHYSPYQCSVRADITWSAGHKYGTPDQRQQNIPLFAYSLVFIVNLSQKDPWTANFLNFFSPT